VNRLQLNNVRIALSILLLSLPSTSCKPGVATADECEKVARHLADLQVKKEKRPPLGRLAAAPFNTKENEDAVFTEAHDNAKARCMKGWKRAVYECMLEAKEMELVDKCRYE
jgi:hypothetical protein